MRSLVGRLRGLQSPLFEPRFPEAFVNFVRLLPVILSLLVLGAHFYRAGNLTLVAASLLVLLLLVIRRPWVRWIAQAALVLGAAEWVRSTLAFVGMRQAMDLPWTRLAVILGSVAAFTLLSALVFFIPALRRRYQQTGAR